ncbi:unnamed protein product [Rhodiola kirilowii]
MDRIFEAFEAMVGDAGFESLICEECFFNGRETEWRVEETMGEGEEENLSCSLNENLTHRNRQYGLEELGGDRDRDSCRGKSGEEPIVANPSEANLEGQGPSESHQLVLATPLGKVVSCEPNLSRVGGNVKDSGKMISLRDVSDCRWNASLNSLLQKNEKGSVEPVPKVQAGLSLCLTSSGLKVQGKEIDQAELEETSLEIQDGEVAEVGHVPEDKSSGKSSDRVCDTYDNGLAALSQDDSSPRNENLSSREGSIVGGPVRHIKQKPSLARDFGATSHKSFKIENRKVTKEKAVYKVYRRKKRANLDRLKKSYIKELESTNKSSHELVVDSHGALGGIDPDEEERRASQRKEAENNVRIAKVFGLKASTPEEEEEAVQIFIKRDEDQRRHQYEDERRNRQ